jgi:hypothetical protein
LRISNQLRHSVRTAGCHGEQGTISGAKLGTRHLATQHLHLVAQDEHLEVTAENRGVPGSSPGLAIEGIPANRLFLSQSCGREMSG